VDHPATQAWKREALANAGIAIPSCLTFASVDFERQTLADGLGRAGFDASAPAMFSWLGVTMYLSGEAFDATLDFIASRPAGTIVIFDYAVDRAMLPMLERFGLSALERRVERAGEPFRLFMQPPVLRNRLSGLGFDSIQDVGAAELNARYFAGRPDNLRVSGSLGRIAIARRERETSNPCVLDGDRGQ
jgi:methyltransferase (TIGR00027 family)